MVLSLSVSARDTYARDASVLPTGARVTLDKNFKAKVSVVKIEKTLGRVDDYEVVLTDGTEVEFDRNGNWKNVETSSSKSVPASIIPVGIREHCKKYHSSARIVGIERNRGGYEVELSTGIEIKFNKEGKFVRYDD